MNEYVNKIIELYTKSKLDEDAKTEFHNWLTEDDDLASEKEGALYNLWNQTENMPSKGILDSLAIVKLRAKINSEQKRSKLIVWKYAVAIVLILSVTSIYLFTNNNSKEIKFVEHFSPAGQIDLITLPDGSIVRTNSRSILVYPESFGEDTRVLYLSGEANFDVKRNEDLPFIVKTKDFSVTALGTEFDVFSYAEESTFKATLIKGSIQINRNDNQGNYLLKVKEQFVYNRQEEEYSISKVDLYEATSWQRGELVFRSVTIKDILSSLERKFAVSFQYKSNVFNDDKFTFRFKKESTLPEVLDIIKEVSGGFQYKKIGDSYYIIP